MLVEYIEQLRKKPHHVRQRIALLASGVTMLVIFYAWVFNLQHLLAKHTAGDEESASRALQNEVVEITRETPSLIASVKSGFGSLIEQFKQIEFESGPDDVQLEPDFDFTDNENQPPEDDTFGSFLDVYDQYYSE